MPKLYVAEADGVDAGADDGVDAGGVYQTDEARSKMSGPRTLERHGMLVQAGTHADVHADRRAQLCISTLSVDRRAHMAVRVH